MFVGMILTPRGLWRYCEATDNQRGHKQITDGVVSAVPSQTTAGHNISATLELTPATSLTIEQIEFDLVCRELDFESPP